MITEKYVYNDSKSYLPIIQAQQFITLLLLIVIGKVFVGVYPSWIMIIMVFFTTFSVENLFLLKKYRKISYFTFSPLSTAIGIILMLSSTKWWIYIIVAIFSIAQKYILTIENKHFFNPSNFAIIAAMMLFYRQSHIIMGQLGDGLWFETIVVILSIFILTRVDRWIIPVVFVMSYLILEYSFVVGYDPVMTFDMVYERFYAVSFVLFVVFMLTDPRTSPDPRWQQVIFVFVISMIAAYLDRINGFRAQHLFMALFVVSPWVPSLKNSKTLPWSAGLFILALGVIIFIENQPPFYFEMEG